MFGFSCAPVWAYCGHENSSICYVAALSGPVIGNVSLQFRVVGFIATLLIGENGECALRQRIRGV